MAKFHFGASALGLTFAALSATTAFAQVDDAELMKTVSTEGVVTSDQTCEYEGGSVMTLEAGKVCFVAVRGTDFNTKLYDGQGLGVIKCSGNGQFANELVQPSGAFCRVFLEQKKVAPSRAEVEAATRAEMKAAEDLAEEG
ncbi:hypothetical protein ACJ3XI_02520 [Litorimonas sp. RW-G-Af-16]|uniref:hypothetical protein n=1 Tax=Litorimonas sp. RW-G-Af-16 TaxID=3241168 RepID=UPI00390CAB6E